MLFIDQTQKPRVREGLDSPVITKSNRTTKVIADLAMGRTRANEVGEGLSLSIVLMEYEMYWGGVDRHEAEGSTPNGGVTTLSAVCVGEKKQRVVIKWTLVTGNDFGRHRSVSCGVMGVGRGEQGLETGVGSSGKSARS